MDRKIAYALAGIGILTAGVVIYMRRRTLSALGQSAVDNAGLFALAIPNEAAPYAATILAVASETGVDPFLIAAVGQRESRWGQALDSSGTGDYGHGHGIMQIDDRTWGSWIASNDWLDPYVNVSKGAEILAANLAYFEGKGLTGDQLTAAAAAAYNHGPGNVWSNLRSSGNPDVGTAGGNYGSAVLAMASSFASSFAA